ncbi:N-acetylmuramidase domain-containing protein, partial [Mesorhizobium sp.]
KLRKHDWAGFAKGYNGASFGKNAYDYQACRRVPQKWSGIRTRRGRPLPQHSLQRRFLRS